MALDIQAFKGVRDLVIAKMTVSNDESGKIVETYGEVQPLAGVQNIGFDVNESSATHYFDNIGALVIASEGEDTLTLTVSRTDLKTRALIEGRTYDETKKALIATEQNKPYFAIGFKAKLTNGTEEWYWFYKGKFTAGSKEFATQDDGTDINTMQYTFAAVYTGAEFEIDGKTQPVKYALIEVADETKEPATSFFSAVTTPDKIATPTA